MSMAASGGGEGGDSIAEINVTPMVDVLLCLLIIFMVSTPDPPKTQLPLAVPQQAAEQPASADPNATLLITLEKDGSARLGQTPLPVDHAGMVLALQANEKLQHDRKVAIHAATGVKYGVVVQVMAAAHEAGIDDVGIASDRF